MPLPILAALGIGAGLKAAGGLFKHKGKQKAGKEQYNAAKETHAVQDAARGDRNAANQALLRSLFAGRYAVPEDVFSNIQKPRPFTGADPTAGAGWDLAGSALGAVGDMASAYSLSKYPTAPSTPPLNGGAGMEGEMGGPPLEDISVSPMSFPEPPPEYPAPSTGNAGAAGVQYDLGLNPWDEGYNG